MDLTPWENSVAPSFKGVSWTDAQSRMKPFSSGPQIDEHQSRGTTAIPIFCDRKIVFETALISSRLP
jgi:hypothetical protein